VKGAHPTRLRRCGTEDRPGTDYSSILPARARPRVSSSA
jgi:hypothetical protein